MKTPTALELIRTPAGLVAALDSRVAHIERLGEESIARDAATLRVQALKRIGEVQRSEAGAVASALAGGDA